MFFCFRLDEGCPEACVELVKRRHRSCCPWLACWRSRWRVPSRDLELLAVVERRHTEPARLGFQLGGADPRGMRLLRGIAAEPVSTQWEFLQSSRLELRW